MIYRRGYLEVTYDQNILVDQHGNKMDIREEIKKVLGYSLVPGGTTQRKLETVDKLENIFNQNMKEKNDYIDRVTTKLLGKDSQIMKLTKKLKKN